MGAWFNYQDVLARVGGENSKDTLSGDMEPATLPPTINVTGGLSFQVIRKVCDDDDIFIAFPVKGMHPKDLASAVQRNWEVVL